VFQGLIFQELQSELEGSVRREIALKTSQGIVIADGIIEASHETALVEVKLASDARSALNLLQYGTRQLLRMSAALHKGEQPTPIRLILAVVVEGREDDARQIENLVRVSSKSYWHGVEIRVFSYNQLLKKYGFPVPENEVPFKPEDQL
jgi:hypothetical protein